MSPTPALRVRAITPLHVGPSELARRQARYDAFSPEGVEVHLDDLPDDADVPRRLDDADAIDASDALVAAEAARTDPAAFDVVLPDCVLDPGLDRLRAAGFELPVVGITELAAHAVAGIGGRLAAVTRNAAIGAELAERFEVYGLSRRFAGVQILELGFEAVADHAVWNAALAGVRERLAGSGVTAILNGCSAVDVEDSAGAVVFDPTRLALGVLAVSQRQSLLPAAGALTP